MGGGDLSAKVGTHPSGQLTGAGLREGGLFGPRPLCLLRRKRPVGRSPYELGHRFDIPEVDSQGAILMRSEFSDRQLTTNCYRPTILGDLGPKIFFSEDNDWRIHCIEIYK